MNKKISSKSITKSNLASAYWTLYKENGVQKVTVKDITSLAGYNRSTFYEYFKDVQDVQEYIENSILDYVRQEILPKDLDFFNTEEVINRLTVLFETKGEYLSVLLSGNPLFIKRFKNLMKDIMFQSYPIDKKNPYAPYIFEYIISATIGTLNYWFQADDELSLREIIKFIRTLNTGDPQKELLKPY